MYDRTGLSTKCTLIKTDLFRPSDPNSDLFRPFVQALIVTKTKAQKTTVMLCSSHHIVVISQTLPAGRSEATKKDSFHTFHKTLSIFSLLQHQALNVVLIRFMMPLKFFTSSCFLTHSPHFYVQKRHQKLRKNA